MHRNSENAMTTIPTTFERSVRHALLAMFSAGLLAACGGGDTNTEEPDAAATPSVSFEAASAQSSRAPMGGGRRVPICMDARLECQPNVPPAQ
jgi:hypothetical protein